MRTPSSVEQTLAAYIRDRVPAARRRPLVVGICGAQGSGKTTLSEAVRPLLEAAGLAAVVLSIDDVYLTRERREALAKDVHPLLRTRGVPGTHDVDLGVAVLQALGRDGSVVVPRFDKATDDRVPPERWHRVDAPVEVVIFEGWCVGARPQSEAALLAPISDWERRCDPRGTWRRFVNESLAGRYQEWFSRVDVLVLLEAPAFEVVFGWRLEQEHALRAALARQGRSAEHVMSEAELAHFVGHYERLTRHILAEMPARADVLISLDERRNAVVARL